MRLKNLRSGGVSIPRQIGTADGVGTLHIGCRGGFSLAIQSSASSLDNPASSRMHKSFNKEHGDEQRGSENKKVMELVPFKLVD